MLRTVLHLFPCTERCSVEGLRRREICCQLRTWLSKPRKRRKKPRLLQQDGGQTCFGKAEVYREYLHCALIALVVQSESKSATYCDCSSPNTLLDTYAPDGVCYPPHWSFASWGTSLRACLQHEYHAIPGRHHYTSPMLCSMSGQFPEVYPNPTSTTLFLMHPPKVKRG